MAAYLIVDIDVTDPVEFEEYRKQVPASIAKYGGKYLVRGGPFEVPEGNWTPKRVVVIEFESMERVKQWYTSPEYSPLKRLRQKAAITNAVFVQGV